MIRSLTVLANTLAGGWLDAGWGPELQETWRLPLLPPRTACAPGEATMRRSGALDPRTAARLRGEAGRHGFLSLLTRICESCCQVRCEPRGKFQLHSGKRTRCLPACWWTFAKPGYARPTWSPKEMRRQEGFQPQGAGCHRSWPKFEQVLAERTEVKVLFQR